MNPPAQDGRLKEAILVDQVFPVVGRNSGKENGKLKRLVAELALDKQILKDIAEGNF